VLKSLHAGKSVDFGCDVSQAAAPTPAESTRKIEDKTRWLLAASLWVALWPAPVQSQSAALIDAYHQFSELYAQGRYQEALPFAEKTVRLTNSIGRDQAPLSPGCFRSTPSSGRGRPPRRTSQFDPNRTFSLCLPNFRRR
jgi:hypothetical protein